MAIKKYDLKKDYEKGGKRALKGYNFQHYTGIYYMIVLYKKGESFKIGFEKEDDIVVYLGSGLNYKIQAKSSELNAKKLILKPKKIGSDERKLSILEKLFEFDGFDYYKICFPYKKYDGLNDNCYKETEKGIGEKCFVLDSKDHEITKFLENQKIDNQKLILQEAVYTESGENASKYLSSLASWEFDKVRIEMSASQIYKLLGLISEYAASDSLERESFLDNTYIDKIYNDNFINMEIEKCLEILESKKNALVAAKYRNKLLDYKLNILYYKEKFSDIKLSNIGEQGFYEYFTENQEKICNESEIDREIVGIHIIYEFVLEVVEVGNQIKQI